MAEPEYCDHPIGECLYSQEIADLHARIEQLESFAGCVERVYLDVVVKHHNQRCEGLNADSAFALANMIKAEWPEIIAAYEARISGDG